MDPCNDATEQSTAIDCRDQNLITLPSLQQYQLLLTLNCSDNKLSALPWDIGSLHALQTLDCGNNNLTTLPASIDGLTSLTRLDCSSNQLNHLPDSIGALYRLHYLNCSNNNIHTLPHSIETLVNLCKFKTLWNRPGCLNGIQLWKLRNLTTLHADILNIPSTNCFSFMPNLTSIITSMESTYENDYENDAAYTSNCTYMDNLPAVESLVSVMSVMSAMGPCSALKTFHVNNYTFDTLPIGIGSVQSLTQLHCRANQITWLPCTIGQLVQLKELNLEQNLLTCLPKTIGCMTSLVELNVQSNQLKLLPDQLYSLTQLETLLICDNDLNTLSPLLVRLTSLQTFVYFNNPISMPPNVRRFVDLIPSINQAINVDIEYCTNDLPRCYIERVCHILSQPLIVTPEIFSTIMQEIQSDPILWDDTKSIIEKFCLDTTVDSSLFLTYQELLTWSWRMIGAHNTTKQRLNYLTTMVMNRPVQDRLVSLVASLDDANANIANINQFYFVYAIYNALTHYGVNCKNNKELFFREIQTHIHPGTPRESILIKRYIDHLVKA